jgi:hypothetical protein
MCTCICFVTKGYMQVPKFLQAHTDNVDSNYINPYTKDLTGRLFLSNKYSRVKIPGSANHPSFTYMPNTKLAIGIGATYHSFTFNLAYGTPLLNAGKAQKGKTTYLDLQGHIYSRKFAVDFLGQLYKGYYISPQNFVPGYSSFFLRPDLRVRLVGLAAYYIFNNKEFSYRASMIQSERQLKSAGTFLLGGELCYGIVKGDAPLIPLQISEQYPQGAVNRLRFAKIGPSFGYAYTFVYDSHWFATGSITINASLDFIRENTIITYRNHFAVSPDYMTRLAIGYNSRRWIYTASWVNTTAVMKGSYNDANYKISSGNYRLTVAHRFTLNRKAKKMMKPADKFIDATKKLIQ